MLQICLLLHHLARFPTSDMFLQISSTDAGKMIKVIMILVWPAYCQTYVFIDQNHTGEKSYGRSRCSVDLFETNEGCSTAIVGNDNMDKRTDGFASPAAWRTRSQNKLKSSDRRRNTSRIEKTKKKRT